MNLPGWYISDPDDIELLPVAERYGVTLGYEEEDILHETERGKKWVYKLFRRRVRKITFRFTEAQYPAFEALHLAVEGQLTPFWYVADSDDPSSAIFVRKEKDFLPKELDEPASDNGTTTAVYEYELILTGEVDDLEIEA